MIIYKLHKKSNVTKCINVINNDKIKITKYILNCDIHINSNKQNIDLISKYTHVAATIMFEPELQQVVLILKCDYVLQKIKKTIIIFHTYK